MLNLIRLELVKFKLWPVIKGAFIALLVMLGFVTLIMFDGEFKSYDDAFRSIDIFVKAVFMIFGASLIAKFIIQEFKEKTMIIMFMYPINRKKMMIAKLFIIMIFTFLSIVICDIVIFSFFYVLNVYYSVITEPLTMTILLQNGSKLLMNAIAATGISLIPLYFGMKKYSVRTTIVSAVIIMSLLTSSLSGHYSLYDIILVPITLACVGLLIAYMTVRKIEQVDLFK
ncbi:ABC transporter permease [Bacillus cereus group sp. BfR-BA-01380]|uniref:ABC transporter permease n=1 Tax=Bacillus cereus group sp. BfR-BA-01380 TaxID=2920324 RepID=UPI001F589DFA|nr:ABC transporter permease [Bacillus cereus group sp. BfR-BA-01380]